MSEAPPVLLTGARAQVGLHVLRDLLASGISTFALSRKVTTSEQISHPSGARVIWYHPEQFSELIGSAEAAEDQNLAQPECLLSAGPLQLAELWLDRCQSLRRIVCLSTSSVFSKSDSAHSAERKQIEEILQSEKRLVATCTERNIDLVILRPTLIYGCGLDENISRMTKFIDRFGFIPLAGKAKGLRQPIHVADLAQLIVTIARSEMSGQNSYEVAGGSTLTYWEMTARVFSALGKRERLFSLPPALLAGSVALASKLPGMGGLNPQMVFRQNQDLVFADEDVQQRFVFQPRSFNPGPDDFRLPADIRLLLPASVQHI